MNCRRKLLTGTLGICAILAAGAASARTIQASAGYAKDPTRQTCMTSQWYSGGVVNNCDMAYPGAYTTWVVPLEVDNAGWHAATVTAWVGNAGTSRCRLEAWNNTITSPSFGAWFPLPIGNRSSENSGRLDSPWRAWVPDGGFLYIVCEIGKSSPEGGQTLDVLEAINWNP